jgi:hypothetical protein
MKRWLSWDLLYDFDFPERIRSACQIKIARMKARLNQLIQRNKITEIPLFCFGKRASPINQHPIAWHIQLSDIFNEQERIIQLIYSITTVLKPVNFDLSIFFITSPPLLNQELCHDDQ